MDALSQEKRVARRRYRRLQQLKLLLRCLEAVAALLLLSWSSARLPAVARLSGHLLRRLVAVLLSPRFVFLVGNAIVLLLFANSGRLQGASADPAEPSSPPADIYDEYLECKSRVQPLLLPQPTEPSQPEDVPVEKEKQETLLAEGGDEEEEEEEEDAAAVAAEEVVAEEDAEEFRQTIEAFIAKQLRFHREESMGRVRCSAGAPESSVIACH